LLFKLVYIAYTLYKTAHIAPNMKSLKPAKKTAAKIKR